MKTEEPKKERERLKPPKRGMSEFFFEQRLFDFTNKNLQPYITEEMKKYMDENAIAKEKVGSMLLAFEYFNAISEIQLEYNAKDFLDVKSSFKQKMARNIKRIFFFIFFLCIVLILLSNLEALINYFGPYFI